MSLAVAPARIRKLGKIVEAATQYGRTWVISGAAKHRAALPTLDPRLDYRRHRGSYYWRRGVANEATGSFFKPALVQQSLESRLVSCKADASPEFLGRQLHEMEGMPQRALKAAQLAPGNHAQALEPQAGIDRR
jgi:hypothetical protein